MHSPFVWVDLGSVCVITSINLFTVMVVMAIHVVVITAVRVGCTVVAVHVRIVVAVRVCLDLQLHSGLKHNAVQSINSSKSTADVYLKRTLCFELSKHSLKLNIDNRYRLTLVHQRA